MIIKELTAAVKLLYGPKVSHKNTHTDFLILT